MEILNGTLTMTFFLGEFDKPYLKLGWKISQYMLSGSYDFISFYESLQTQY